MIANLEDDLLHKVRELPDEKKREVLNFVEFLRQQSAGPKTGKSLAGLWADLNIDITEEELRQIRQEMWANFPRDM